MQRSNKTDMPTVVGMRFAMLDAVEMWRGQEDKTAAKAIELVVEACENHPMLEAAGTANIVAAFYKNLLEGSKDKVVPFLNSIPEKSLNLLSKTMLKIESGKKGWWISFNLMRGCAPFSSGLKQFLGQDTLTDSFLRFVERNRNQDELTPAPLSRLQIHLVTMYDKIARIADKGDSWLGNPMVSGSWLNFNPKLENGSLQGEDLMRARMCMPKEPSMPQVTTEEIEALQASMATGVTPAPRSTGGSALGGG